MAIRADVSFFDRSLLTCSSSSTFMFHNVSCTDHLRECRRVFEKLEVDGFLLKCD